MVAVRTERNGRLSTKCLIKIILFMYITMVPILKPFCLDFFFFFFRIKSFPDFQDSVSSPQRQVHLFPSMLNLSQMAVLLKMKKNQKIRRQMLKMDKMLHLLLMGQTKRSHTFLIWKISMKVSLLGSKVMLKRIHIVFWHQYLKIMRNI